MIYFNSEQQKLIPQSFDSALQQYFPTRDFGVALVLQDDNGDIELVSIDKVTWTGGGRHGDEQIWTHYANIQKTDDGRWEINEQFKGENEDMMFVYAYYKKFAGAVHNLALQGTENRIPIKVY